MLDDRVTASGAVSRRGAPRRRLVRRKWTVCVSAATTERDAARWTRRASTACSGRRPAWKCPGYGSPGRCRIGQDAYGCAVRLAGARRCRDHWQDRDGVILDPAPSASAIGPAPLRRPARFERAAPPAAATTTAGFRRRRRVRRGLRLDRDPRCRSRDDPDALAGSDRQVPRAVAGADVRRAVLSRRSTLSEPAIALQRRLNAQATALPVGESEALVGRSAEQLGAPFDVQPPRMTCAAPGCEKGLTDSVSGRGRRAGQDDGDDRR